MEDKKLPRILTQKEKMLLPKNTIKDKSVDLGRWQEEEEIRLAIELSCEEIMCNRVTDVDFYSAKDFEEGGGLWSLGAGWEFKTGARGTGFYRCKCPTEGI